MLSVNFRVQVPLAATQSRASDFAEQCLTRKPLFLSISKLVSRCSDPSQPLWIISGLKILGEKYHQR